MLPSMEVTAFMAKKRHVVHVTKVKNKEFRKLRCIQIYIYIHKYTHQ